MFPENKEVHMSCFVLSAAASLSNLIVAVSKVGNSMPLAYPLCVRQRNFFLFCSNYLLSSFSVVNIYLGCQR